MLARLSIRDIVLIDRLDIDFAAGLSALTGETGAGKSIVIDALGAVLGERVSSDLVRGGEERAYIEAAFDVSSAPNQAEIAAALTEFGIELDPEEPLILSRDITAAGRSTARVNGRALTAAALTQIGELLVDIHGQSDHLSLLRPNAQLDLLDRFAGALELRAEVREQVRTWRDLRRRLQRFDDEERERAQRLDLLRFQSEEIGEAQPRPDEDDELRRERNLLMHAEQLAGQAAEAHALLSADDPDGPPGALDRLRLADTVLTGMSDTDSALAALATQLRDALYALEDVAIEVRDYGERLLFDPARLAEVDDRLELLRGLTRKYGPTIEDVLTYAEGIQPEIEELEGLGLDLDQLRAHEQQTARQLAELAHQLSQRRRAAAGKLAAQVEQTISELNMGRAVFEVRFTTALDDDGIELEGQRVGVDETGADRVAFYLAANRGEEPRPLARVASGGETARLMLALKSILSDVDATPTLVFDEIDVGVGGRSGQMVGEKLWNLTSHHQVIVISHLPQVAAFAERHVSMVKVETDGRTETTAQVLSADKSLDEIAEMFDGRPVTPESRANAVALVRRVDAWKARAGKRQTAPLL
jgi:DNA repair protein RecN (Recombination protein N)